MTDVQAIYESLKVVRKGTEDEFELRSSADEKVWAVRLVDDNPNKPTYAVYAGPDAKEYACDLADFDLDDDEDGDDADDDEDDDDTDD